MSRPTARCAPTEAAPGAAARVARATLEADLRSVPALSARLTSPMLDRLEAYVAMLLETNQRLNLTRITDPVAVARQHLLDSLVALAELDEVAPLRAVDVGSGGGVPAIPLAICRPDLSWLLLESVMKKARALESFVERLGLRGIRVIPKRAEEVGRDREYRERAGIVTARAVAVLPVLVELALPLLARGGVMLAWKGSMTQDDGELLLGARAARQLGGGAPDLVAPGAPQLGGHTLVRVRKERLTPGRYPRSPGEPARRPLG